MKIRKRIIITRGIRDKNLVFLYPINTKFTCIKTQGIKEWIPQSGTRSIYLFECQIFKDIFGWIPEIGSKQEIYFTSI